MWRAAMEKLAFVMVRLAFDETGMRLRMSEPGMTHAQASNVWQKHCGYHCEDLVSRMEQGEEDLHSEEWILDVVRYGDIFFSLNNRHLWVSLAVSERCQRDDAKNNKTKNWTGSLRTDFSPRYFLPYLRCRATGIEYHE